MADSSAHNVEEDWGHFDPAAYLEEYYADVGSENLALLRFLAETYQDLPKGGTLLDFGGGPTIYPLISAAARVDEIHFSDYLQVNLAEVGRWLRDEPGAFDWRGFIRTAIELETGAPCTDEDVEQRVNEIRSRVTRLSRCDASRNPPVDCPDGLYDIVLSNFCAESATSDHSQWRAFMENIVSVLKPGGRLVVCALKGATEYAVGTRSFPAVNINEDDLIEMLEETGFHSKGIEVRSVPADRPSRDYDGLMLAVAEKKTAAESR